MKNKKYLICFLIWACFIWSNSLLPGKTSSGLSGGLSYQIYEFLNLGIPFELFHTFVRKCAHFSEYALLGVFAALAFKKEKFVYAVVLGILVACTDEIIQLFVSGRSGQISDVLIDSCGVLFGGLVVLACRKFKKE